MPLDSAGNATNSLLTVNALQQWSYLLLSNNTDYGDTTVHAVAKLVLQHEAPLNTGYYPFSFEVFHIADSNYCFSKLKQLRATATCESPDSATGIIILNKYIFFSEYTCLPCKDKDGKEYCRAIINQLFAGIDLSKANTPGDIVKQFPIKGQILKLPDFKEMGMAAGSHVVPQPEPIPVISNEKLDTLKQKAYYVEAKPIIFETAFFKGTITNIDTLLTRLYTINIGDIQVESGKLIACDPIVMRDAKPFSANFPIGHFPVQLALANVNGDERIAFSRIMFSDKPVAQWRFALHDGQQPVSIFGETLYGYGVDAGIGLFIDEKANLAFNRLDKQNDSLWDEVFTKEMDKHLHATWQYVLYNFGKHNLAAFSTGWGDGTYGTYIGYDANGNICRLLTDFGLIEWWKK